MKLTITREDLRQFVLKEANINISQALIDIDIVKEEKEPKKAEIKNKRCSNLKNHPDYTDYENTVLDFATSSEHKRQVPFFGAGTIECCKARYQKMIDKLGIKDSVKFSRLNFLPYLVKIEGEKSMGDILNEGINK